MYNHDKIVIVPSKKRNEVKATCFNDKAIKKKTLSGIAIPTKSCTFAAETSGRF